MFLFTLKFSHVGHLLIKAMQLKAERNQDLQLQQIWRIKELVWALGM